MSELKTMKKTVVSVRLVHGQSSATGTEKPVTFSFIYGIGRDGLSPFEQRLELCSVGQCVQFEVKADAVAESFGGLFAEVRELIEGKVLPENLVFEIKIIKLEDVENREVVAALARSASGCGSGGSCGCGCS
jgi:hypothetical protein